MKITRTSQQSKRVSKAFEEGVQAGELDDSLEEMFVVFVAHDKASAILSPADGSLDDKASPIATESLSVLAAVLSAAAMRTHQFHVACVQHVAQPVAVGAIENIEATEEPRRRLAKSSRLSPFPQSSPTRSRRGVSFW